MVAFSIRLQPLPFLSNRSLTQAPVPHAYIQLDRQKERTLLDRSTTLYIGNLSFFTTEQQIYESQS
jgi:RNA recognition motif-containing protein